MGSIPLRSRHSLSFPLRRGSRTQSSYVDFCVNPLAPILGGKKEAQRGFAPLHAPCAERTDVGRVERNETRRRSECKFRDPTWVLVGMEEIFNPFDPALPPRRTFDLGVREGAAKGLRPSAHPDSVAGVIARRMPQASDAAISEGGGTFPAALPPPWIPAFAGMT